MNLFDKYSRKLASWRGGAIHFPFGKNKGLDIEAFKAEYFVRYGKELSEETAQAIINNQKIDSVKEKISDPKGIAGYEIGRAVAGKIQDIRRKKAHWISMVIIGCVGLLIYGWYSGYWVNRALDYCKYDAYKGLGAYGGQDRFDGLVVLCMKTKGYDYKGGNYYQKDSYK